MIIASTGAWPSNQAVVQTLIGLWLVGCCCHNSLAHPFRRIQNITEEEKDREMQEYWTERYKQKILNRLHMSAPPAVNDSASNAAWDSVPQYLQDRLKRTADRHSIDTDLNEEADGELKETIIVAKPISRCLTGGSSACFILDIVDDIPRHQLVSVTLHAEVADYAVQGRHLSLWEASHVNNGVTLKSPSLSHTQVDTSPGRGPVPVQMDLTAAFSNWARHRQRSRAVRKIARTVVVRCENCDFEGRPPIDVHKVILEIRYTTLHRKKRSIIGRCGALGFRCCTQSYSLNFKTVNWHHWVIFPPEFEPNYCKGKCSGGSSPQTHHAEIMQILSRPGNTEITDVQKRHMTPCCAPSGLASMTLMYIDQAGNIRLETLHNLIVNRCGCM